ncbi:hypothetical protein BDD12DRAFT_634038, partial [Trichophaea hybrida]
GSFSHESLAGAAGFEAFKIYEDSRRQEGKPIWHQFAKEMMAGVATAEAEKLCETQGLDAMESEWTREGAVRQAHWLYDE